MVAAAVPQAGVRRLFERSEPDMRSQAFLSQVASETNKTLPSTVDKFIIRGHMSCTARCSIGSPGRPVIGPVHHRT
jgi:hypothetical protein